MATAQRITRDGATLYRVQIRRPTKGIKVDRYFTGKREADAFIREVEAAIRAGKPISDNVSTRLRFSEALKTYLEDDAAFTTPKGRELKPSAKRDRQHRLEWLSKHLLGEVVLKNITWELIDQKLGAEAKARKWSPATRYHYETTLSRFLDYCRKQGWVALNVTSGKDRLNIAERRERTYTDDEWQRLLDAADDQKGMLGMFLRLAWETGARKSELRTLRWVDVEPLDDEHLGAALSLRDTKNREPRKVFISKATFTLLQAHAQEHRRPSSDLVFPSRTRAGLWSVDLLFREARTAAKLDAPDAKHGEILNIHHIRHTWATRLGDAGVTLAQLMAAAGWKTPGMAERYMKRKESQSAEAARLLIGR